MTIKKLFFLLFLMNIHHFHAMEIINYNSFFNVCVQGDKSAVKAFIKNNPKLEINCQNDHGETALLRASYNRQWPVVRYLLKNGADKYHMAKDGQSLFSNAVYDSTLEKSSLLSSLFELYSPQDINNFCKHLPLNTGKGRTTKHPLDDLEKKVLDRQKNIECSDELCCNTALHYACMYKHIPIIVELLKRGAPLQVVNKKKETPYSVLTKMRRKPNVVLFAIREALNVGSCLPTSLLIYEVLEANFVPDIARYIKQLYVALVNPLPELLLWKPVCVHALKFFGINDTNEDRCLRNVLSWSQEIKTIVNIQLFLDGK